METLEKVQLLWDLFVNRNDTYTEQWYDESRGSGYKRKTEGTCDHSPPCARGACDKVKSIPLRQSDLVAHLKAEKTVGIYAISQDETCKWLCFDLDGTNNKLLREGVYRLAKYLTQLLGKGYVNVETSGRRGYHLWLFFTEPVTAQQVRDFALYVYDNMQQKMPEGVTIESYPKQANGSSFGSQVKLPLGVHQQTKNRCFYLDASFNPLSDQWEKLTSIQKLDANKLTQYKPDRRIMEGAPGGSVAMPCMTRAMEEGFPEGKRDGGTFRLGIFLKDRGFPYDIAYGVASHVNERSQPPLDDSVLVDKLRSAYQGTYSVFPCFDESFDSYCSSSCRFFSRKVEDRWVRFGRPPSEAARNISRD